MKRRIAVFGLMILAALMIIGCAPKLPVPTVSVKPTATATPIGTTAIATATTQPTGTAAVTPSPTPTNVTEKRIGFVRKAYTEAGVNYITIDYVNFLSGDAAIEKAKEDGKAEQDENGKWFVSNDYYISNDNKAVRTFPLKSNCTIKVVDWDSNEDITSKSITFAELKSKGPEFDDGELLMDVDVVNGLIKSMVERYRP